MSVSPCGVSRVRGSDHVPGGIIVEAEVPVAPVVDIDMEPHLGLYGLPLRCGARYRRAVISRLWQARIDPTRSAEYEEFAHRRSLPTFRAHTGFRGCSFLGAGEDRAVLTLWDSMADVAALEGSTRYRETVAAIMSTGFVLSATESLTAELQD